MRDLIGRTLGHYRIVERIGEGGMGVVYRAHDERLDRDVAIKVLPEEVAGDPERLRRFEREAKAVATLSHPNILEIFDFDTEDDVTYAVTELLEGETLREHLQNLGGPLPLAKVLKTGASVAKGLGAAHSRGVVHRDVKPSNIFLCEDGRVKILDFGLAAIRGVVDGEAETESLQAPLTLEGKVLGTVGYMAPEQVRGQPVDHRSDIFSFGCVFYEMLSGQRAFRGETSADTLSAILSKDPSPLSDCRQDLPPSLQEIVSGCLEKRPEERSSSMQEIASSIQAISESPDREPLPSADIRRTTFGLPSAFAILRKPLVVLPLLAVVAAAIVVVGRVLERRSSKAWASGEAVPEIFRLAEDGETLQALVLARKIEDRLPGTELLEDVWPKVAVETRWRVTPPGTSVFARSRKEPDTGWVPLGNANGQPLRTPIGSWLFRLEHPGHEPVEAGLKDAMLQSRSFDLPSEGELPRGMVRVNTGGRYTDFWLDYPDHDRLRGAPVDTFLIDRFEVTNVEYRRFVDAGGYHRPEFWKETFVKDGKVFTWDEAMGLLRDTTGRPGPATWEVGTFPDGSDDLPVGGVSWYEAAAYAEFVGKRLPTVYHWEVASGIDLGAGIIIPSSNFSGSLARVGSFRGSLTPAGLYDTAGNAREWCSNAAGELRVTLGGACDGPTYFFVCPESRPPFDRNPTSGFRCMKLLGGTANSDALEQPLKKRPPVSLDSSALIDDAAWATWRSFLSYPESPLDARLEFADESSTVWRTEKVTFSAAYDADRVIAYLFLPKNRPPPYQVVVFFPGAYAWYALSSDDGEGMADRAWWDYLVKDGRAVIYPILKGTFERRGSLLEGALGIIEARDRLWASKDLTIMKVKDISRSLDYLATRSDMDMERVALLGFSSGGYQAPLPCAADRRLRVCLIVSGGAPYPEVLGFARRATIPVQMVNGRYDTVLPHEEIQRPLFRALGTPEEHKRHVVFDTDHMLSGFEKEMVKVNLEWLDRYLGPVR